MRMRNQLTLPEPVVHAAAIEPGDRFIVEVSPGDPDTVRLHRIRSSYAEDVYGDNTEYVEQERDSWHAGDES